MYPTFSGGRTSPKLSKRLDTRRRDKKRPRAYCRDELEIRPGCRGKKMHSANQEEEWKNIKPSVLWYH